MRRRSGRSSHRASRRRRDPAAGFLFSAIDRESSRMSDVAAAISRSADRSYALPLLPFSPMVSILLLIYLILLSLLALANFRVASGSTRINFQRGCTRAF